MGKQWNDKSEIDKAITVGIHGTPQLRRAEKLRFLGFFRERLLEAVTFSQLRDMEGQKAIEKAIHDRRADELVVHNKATASAMKLVRLAQSKGLDFTITSNPQFTGEVAVAVAAAEAVDQKSLLAEGVSNG